MKPSKLQRHLNTKHATLSKKPIEYFERLLQTSNKEKNTLEKDRVPVKNPNRLTEDEIRAMVQAICDEPEDENEVGRSDTSDDELIQESDHDTELEQ
ncbi:hypothetical protein TNCT_469061 [Trichonephila clavata]|uniref:Uncharacterized protein n=1 Tax=Trichonephila clavata TaxID=2740835 RepID=A0A8X6L129_TRICU|nr:hypothetical protein TNCT_469061 [Trichonephila clavata]